MSGITVIVRDKYADKSKNLDLALKKFKNKIKESQILIDYMDRQYFIKPSAVKRRKKIMAKLRHKHLLIHEN